MATAHDGTMTKFGKRTSSDDIRQPPFHGDIFGYPGDIGKNAGFLGVLSSISVPSNVATFHRQITQITDVR